MKDCLNFKIKFKKTLINLHFFIINPKQPNCLIITDLSFSNNHFVTNSTPSKSLNSLSPVKNFISFLTA